jgi:hypothetical protein
MAIAMIIAIAEATTITVMSDVVAKFEGALVDVGVEVPVGACAAVATALADEKPYELSPAKVAVIV